MIRGIVFDLFDTLVDQNHDRLAPVEIEGRRVGATTPALHARARQDFGVGLEVLPFSDALREVDQGLRRETIDLGVELPTLDRFSALGKHLGCQDVDGFSVALTETHMGQLEEAVSVPAHHEAVLTALAVEYPLALCSNFSHGETARSVMRKAGFEPHFTIQVISDEIGIRKPRPEIFAKVAEELGIPPSEMLHVGDNLGADVAGAAALGFKTVWITRQVRDPDAVLAAYSGPNPDFSLEDLLDLPVLAARLGVR